MDITYAGSGNAANPLTSLAFVKANWDVGSSTPADTFVPLVAVALCSGGPAGIDEAAERVVKKFGIHLPTKVVQNLLSRATRLGLAEVHRKIYTATAEGLERSVAYDAEVVKLHRRRNALVTAFVQYAKGQNVDVEDDAAERLLLKFIQEHSVPLLGSIMRGAGDDVDRMLPSESEYLVAQFVVDMLAREPDLSEYLGDVVKGSMLSASVYSAGTGELDRKFKSTDIYLDTPLLLKALGLEGALAAGPILELIELAHASGAGIRCFEHTLSELRGVVSAAADVLASGKRPPTVRGVLTHYLREGASSSDVLLDLARIDNSVQALNIRVVSRPEHEESLTVDELALHDQLREAIKYGRSHALDHDVDSLTAIHRIRRGRRVEQIERSTALLVTDNSAIVRVSRQFFRSQESAQIGPAILDHDLTTLLWVKRPVEAPDLPLQQVIADSYALMDPGPRVWRTYLDEIDRARDRGEVTSEDVTELRFSIEAHRELMRQTHGKAELVSTPVVKQVLSAARAAAAEPERKARVTAEEERAVAEEKAERAVGRVRQLDGEVTVTETENESLRAMVEGLIASQHQLRTSIAGRAQQLIHRWFFIARLCLVAIGVIGFIVPTLGDVEPAWLRVTITIVGVLFTIGGVVTLVFGGSVRTLMQRWEENLAGSYERRLLRRMGLGSGDGAA